MDDEKENLVNFKYLFDDSYQIHITESAKQGLEIMERIPLKLIIADQRMPNISGIEFLEKVAQLRPDIVRILMTGYTDIELVIDAINRGGVYRYISKPWNENELKSTINNAIDLYNLRLENKEMMQSLRKTNADLAKEIKVREKVETALQTNLQELAEKNQALEDALAELGVLRGIIPICSYCHKIRDDEGAWNQLESYISKHSDAQFSHGICPGCLEREKEKIQRNL